MALVYFDSSAFVKLVVEEAGSDLAAGLWDGCDAAVSSRLAYPEVRAALAAAARNHVLDDGEVESAERAWEEFWAATRRVELTSAVEREATWRAVTPSAAPMPCISRAPSPSGTPIWSSPSGTSVFTPGLGQPGSASHPGNPTSSSVLTRTVGLASGVVIDLDCLQRGEGHSVAW